MAPLRRKLKLMILLTSAAVPLLSVGALLAYDVTGLRAVTAAPQRLGIYAAFAAVTLAITGLLAYFTARFLRQLMDALNRNVQQAQQQHRSVQAHLSRMHLLQHITRAIGERQGLQSIFEVVLESVEEDLPVDFCCMCIYDASVETLMVERVGSASRALATEMGLTEQARIPIDAHGLSRCVKGALAYESDTRAVRYPFPQRLARAGLYSVAIAPFTVDNRVFGLLVACRRAEDAFISADCEFLQRLCEHIGLATQQSQLYGALQQAYDDLRQSQHTVLQQERLRALGQMASGIAHDINNAISPVTLYTESLLEREPGLSERARSYLQTIQRAIEDVAGTVARMREFYRPREPQLVLARISVNTLIEQVVDLTRPRWSAQPQQQGASIGMAVRLDAVAPEIVGAEGEIRDALTNLIFNAVDAMPNGGTLTVATRAVEVPWFSAGEDLAQLVYIEVTDTGLGMDDDTRCRCLEPFFTTKGERGTGLGLAMVYGMVQRHSAELEIESAPGEGTTMRLVFARHLRSGAVTERVPTLPLLERRLRILLVDDDPMLIKALQDTLEADGHVITATHGGQQGIEAFTAAHEAGDPFSVVVTDLGMPNVDGRKVAASIKSISSSTPVVMLTGWGQRLIAENDVPPHVNRLLNKPPKLRELRAALAELTAVSA